MAQYSYVSDAQTALEMVQEFGAFGALVRGGVVSYPCHFVFDTFTPFERTNSPILYTDRKLLVAALEIPIVPDPEQDVVFFANPVADLPTNTTMRIVTNVPVAPGGVNVIFTLQARK